ncbi:mechanosensitive ion channel family protein [Listeria grayi]|uniref:Transporter, small conductance mechanosensitive ion channel MscS family protein n=1 Tax=Listeria grayi DSM 20601 TaxID=525367 RepID=D7V117_LISGR|nr:mechanosensitive ion channel family protein [Listeria grayi]EFI83249.1 transporter, small conductance mechanosensitive ion channel MscS family protein [Listeria grayi DSM 20601]
MENDLAKDVTQNMGFFKKWLHSIDWSELGTNALTTSIKILFLIVLYLILKYVGFKLIRGLFKKYRQQQAVSIGRADTLEGLISNLYGYILFFAFAVLILQNFIDVTALVAGAGVAGLAIAFGAQGFVSDVVTGFFILLERQIDVGDSVTIGEVNGLVETLGLRTTQVRDFDGTLHYIPNRQIMIVSNHSRGNMRVMVDIQINPTENPDKATAIIQAACSQMEAENKNIVEPLTVLGVQTVTPTYQVIRVVGKAVNGEQAGVERDILKIAREELTNAGIKFPLPFVAPFNTDPNA